MCLCMITMSKGIERDHGAAILRNSVQLTSCTLSDVRGHSNGSGGGFTEESGMSKKSDKENPYSCPPKDKKVEAN